MNNRKYWLGLIKLHNLGPKLIKNLLEYFGDAKDIWMASQQKLCQVPLIGKKRSQQIIKDRESIDLNFEVQRLKNHQINYLTLNDEEYPYLLKNIHDPPPVLFYKGDIKLEDIISLSIVGSRKCTNYGQKIAKRLAKVLAKRGFTIVSGLARGIDTVSHQGALEAGRTMAVLGSGLDVIYPPENEELMSNITQQGAVISSFPLATPPHGGNFPKRNRIISGLTLGTIVVEATKKSGSLITANYALNQGREVFAIPGDITKKQSFGTNNLIQKGAKLIQEIDDIISELPLEDWLELIGVEDSLKKKEVDIELSDLESKVYNKISSTSQEFNEILKMIDISAGQLNSTLLKLEVKGLITQLAGNRFVLND
ncbi:DNA-processing protein DprA [Selenihalanaerobacter shriftii]|uniref:DNA processing protein n=1 Tax=Selenihalanaerobacter shriftii TaxID=142842 RepID=A0A1T4M9W5_9FIRM|nr:DNA-processing protein DprA [Selenihalanaerobacter shriftii]SJZ63789.1 DNA processing protein [Selenihalanaerobacter shriftii]